MKFSELLLWTTFFKKSCVKKIGPINEKHFEKKLIHMFRIKYYLQMFLQFTYDFW